MLAWYEFTTVDKYDINSLKTEVIDENHEINHDDSQNDVKTPKIELSSSEANPEELFDDNYCWYMQVI